MRKQQETLFSIRPAGLFCAAIICLIIVLFMPLALGQEGTTAQSSLKQGRLLLDHGRFEKAVSKLEAATGLFGRSGKTRGQAAAYQALGRYGTALSHLKTALSLAGTLGDRKMRALILGPMGAAYFFLGQTDRAWERLREGMRIARALRDPEAVAVLSGYIARVHGMQGNYADAIPAYEEGIRFAKTFGDPLLLAGTMAGAASAFLLSGDLSKAQELLAASSISYSTLPDSHTKAYDLILIGRSYAKLASLLPGQKARLNFTAYRAFKESISTAKPIGGQRALSYAYGYTGRLYEEEGRYSDALEWTRRAIFAAQEIGARECLYLWEWQTGRLFKAQGKIKDAIAAYKSAVQSFQAIRGTITSTCEWCGRQDFRDQGGAIFFELADLLLGYSDSLTDKVLIEPYLRDARNTIEMLKVVELQEYFADPCVTDSQTEKTRLEDISDDALVIYTITFPDRLDLLLSSRKGIERVTVPVNAETLRREAGTLRRGLAKRTTWQFLPHAQKIYDWIIHPLEPQIQKDNIRTLIFVPDGPLRTIPMAALHDGKDFIVKRMAVVTAPGLNLTDPGSIHRKENKILLAGLSKGVQGFSPLSNVKQEIDGIG